MIRVMNWKHHIGRKYETQTSTNQILNNKIKKNKTNFFIKKIKGIMETNKRKKVKNKNKLYQVIMMVLKNKF